MKITFWSNCIHFSSKFPWTFTTAQKRRGRELHRLRSKTCGGQHSGNFLSGDEPMSELCLEVITARERFCARARLISPSAFLSPLPPLVARRSLLLPDWSTTQPVPAVRFIGINHPHLARRIGHRRRFSNLADPLRLTLREAMLGAEPAAGREGPPSPPVPPPSLLLFPLTAHRPPAAGGGGAR